MKLEELYKLFSSHKEGRWTINAMLAKRLYSFIQETKVENILELGTGIGGGTALMSLSLKEKGQSCKITSMEQYDKCIKLANELIPEELKENITIHKSEVEVWKNDKIPYQYFSVYKEIPEGDYDLIVADGPASWKDGENYIDLPNGDVMRLLLAGRVKPRTKIIWDKRIPALRLLERFYGDNFFLVEYNTRGGWHILEKKDEPLKFEDAQLKVLTEQTTFFK